MYGYRILEGEWRDFFSFFWGKERINWDESLNEIFFHSLKKFDDHSKIILSTIKLMIVLMWKMNGHCNALIVSSTLSQPPTIQSFVNCQKPKATFMLLTLSWQRLCAAHARTIHGILLLKRLEVNCSWTSGITPNSICWLWMKHLLNHQMMMEAQSIHPEIWPSKQLSSITISANR